MKREEFIIASLLDLDYYKLTMCLFAWKYFPKTLVKYALINRTANVGLADYIDEQDLREEINHICNLGFGVREINYLKQLGFCRGFIDFLIQLRLGGVSISRNGSNYKIEVSGYWPEVILWETLILSVVNELYNRALVKKERKTLREVWQEGKKRLAEKINILELHPEVQFIEFGTRRRFSRAWQEFVIKFLKKRVPKQMIGTSNVFLAMKYNLKPIGTFAHEMYQVFSGIYHSSDEEIKASHNKVIQMWLQEFGKPLSIILTDTYGTDFFFRDFTVEQARFCRGLRHDSGDPIQFGRKAIWFYEELGIDPKTKTIVFSDGLDIETILEISNHFLGEIQYLFGWGTNLTNDFGFKPLSLVVKVIEANGYGTVKLSDNLAKAIGRPEDIERSKKIFGYINILDEPCTY